MFSSFWSYRLQHHDDSTLVGILYPAFVDISSALPRQYKDLALKLDEITQSLKDIDFSFKPNESKYDRDGDKFFSLLKQACDVDKAKVRLVALETLNKLLSFKFISPSTELDMAMYPPLNQRGNNPTRGSLSHDGAHAAPVNPQFVGKKRFLVDVLVESLYNCAMFVDDAVQLAVLKCILTVIQSSSSPTHDQSIILAVRACFHIYISSMVPTNRNTARATVIQVVTLTFQRMDSSYQMVKTLNDRCHVQQTQIDLLQNEVNKEITDILLKFGVNLDDEDDEIVSVQDAPAVKPAPTAPTTPAVKTATPATTPAVQVAQVASPVVAQVASPVVAQVASPVVAQVATAVPKTDNKGSKTDKKKPQPPTVKKEEKEEEKMSPQEEKKNPEEEKDADEKNEVQVEEPTIEEPTIDERIPEKVEEEKPPTKLSKIPSDILTAITAKRSHLRSLHNDYQQLWTTLQHQQDQLVKLQADSYQIIRSLGRQGIRPLTNDPQFVEPPQPPQQRNFLLALELMLHIVKEPGRILSSTLPFLSIIRDDILPCLAFSLTSSIEDIFKLGSLIFQSIVVHFRAELKIELMYFFKFVIIDILQHPNATFHHKVTVLDMLVSLLRDRTLVIELILNSDLSLTPYHANLSSKLTEVVRKKKGRKTATEDDLSVSTTVSTATSPTNSPPQPISPEEGAIELAKLETVLPDLITVPFPIIRDLLLAFQSLLQTNHVGENWMTVRDDQELKTLTTECINSIVRALLSFQSDVLLNKYSSPYPDDISHINGNASDLVIYKNNKESFMIDGILEQPKKGQKSDRSGITNQTTNQNDVDYSGLAPSSLPLSVSRWDELDTYKYIMSKVFLPFEFEELFTLHYSFINLRPDDGPILQADAQLVSSKFLQPGTLQKKLEPFQAYLLALQDPLLTPIQLQDLNIALSATEGYTTIRKLIQPLTKGEIAAVQQVIEVSSDENDDQDGKKKSPINNLINIDWMESKQVYCEFVMNKLQRFLWDCAVYAFNYHGFKLASKIMEHFQLLDVNDPRVLAAWLFYTPGLNKSVVGEVIAGHQRISIETLRYYMTHFHFKDQTFEQSLREFLQAFRIPGEAQCIDRITSAFGDTFCESNPTVFHSPDGAYVLAFSCIMLNTDLHSTQIAKKMTKPEFFKNNSGVDKGHDIDQDLLSQTYDNICLNEIKMKDDQRKHWSQYSPRRRLQMFVQDGRETASMFNRQLRFVQRIIQTQLDRRFPNNQISSGGLVPSPSILTPRDDGRETTIPVTVLSLDEK
jgi:hypothetical protein